MFDRLLAARDAPAVHSLEDCASLTNEQLLRSVTGSAGVALSLLSAFGSLAEVRDAGAAELARIPGIGRRGAERLFAAFELARRVTEPQLHVAPTFRRPTDALAVLTPVLAPLKREVFVVLLLSARNRLLKIHTVSLGSVNASLVHPREVFRPAIQAAAASVILAHNHPSGDPEPSEDDREITARLWRVGELHGIEVLDHLVVGANGSYVSLRERGLM